MHNSLGPLKGYRMLITGIGESVNGLAHLVGVRGAQAAQDGLGQDAEPYLHLVEPGGMGRRVMQIDRGVAGQPPVMRLRAYVQSRREQLADSLTMGGLEELDQAIDDAEAYSISWKEIEPRIWGRIARSVYAFFNLSPLLRRVGRTVDGAEAMATSFLNAGGRSVGGRKPH